MQPFEHTDLQEEAVFCFELEPGGEASLGTFLFGGTDAPDPSASEDPAVFELPAGNYMFAQVRNILSREEFMWMAREVQKEGLRQGASLGNRLYLRYLFEDGKGVTQAFRPLAPDPA